MIAFAKALLEALSFLKPKTRAHLVGIIAAIPLLMASVKGGFAECQQLNRDFRVPWLTRVCGSGLSVDEQKHVELSTKHIGEMPVEMLHPIDKDDDYLTVTVFKNRDVLVMRRTLKDDGEIYQQADWLTPKPYEVRAELSFNLFGRAYAADVTPPAQKRSLRPSLKVQRLVIEHLRDEIFKVQYLYFLGNGTCRHVVEEDAITGNVVRQIEDSCVVEKP